jgi:hypothetical protein
MQVLLRCTETTAAVIIKALILVFFYISLSQCNLRHSDIRYSAKGSTLLKLTCATIQSWS